MNTPPRARHAIGKVAASEKYAEWRRMWAQGRGAQEIAAQLGIPTSRVHNNISSLRKRYGWFPPRDRRADALRQFDRWFALWDKGMPVSMIAASQGVTETYAEETIRRLRIRFGFFPPRASPAHGEAAAREKYAQWLVLWERGLSYSAMADALGVSRSSVQPAVSLLRMRYGWFPYRVPPTERPTRDDLPPPPARTLAKYRSWGVLWAAGAPASAIAKHARLRVGTVRARIADLRLRYGMFPSRRPSTMDAKTARFTPWFRLWDQGKSYADMAAALGKSQQNVTNTVLRYRARYGWFPPRIQSSSPTTHAA